jgi:hypothetical protein
VLEFIISDPRLRGAIFVTTNLSYDFFGTFLEHSDIIELFERKNLLYKATIRQSHKTSVASFVDTLRYYPASVEKLGELLKCPKLVDPRKNDKGAYLYGKPTNDVQMQALTKYCLLDAYISYTFYVDIVYGWCASNNITCGLSNTSNAIKLFRTYFLTHVWKPHSHEINMLVKNAYYGGRVECFVRGKIPQVDHYDINSLYPYCMTKVFPFPNSIKQIEKGTIEHIMQFEGVSFVSLYVEKQRIAPLPFRYQEKLFFPTGYISGWYTHLEIRETLVYGVQILSIGQTIYYEKTFYPFTNWVSTLYAQRMEKKAAGNPLEIMDKLMLNGLYGRFGMAYYDEDSIISSRQFSNDEYLLNDGVEELESGYYRVSNGDVSDVPCFAFPIIAAYVTSYGRLELLHKMKSYEKDILYCDTDSIFLQHSAGTFKTSNDLGDLKAEHGKEPYESVLFIKSKTYMITKKDTVIIKSKGVGKLTQKQFIQMLDEEKITETKLLKFRTAIKTKPHHKMAGVKINAPYTSTKKLDLQDSKRLWVGKFDRRKNEDSLPIHFHSEPKSI